jgi:hypothetical protein
MKGIELKKVRNAKEVVFTGKSFLTDGEAAIVARKTAEFKEQDGSVWFTIYEYVPKMHVLVEVSVFEAIELVAWFKQNATSEHYLIISDDGWKFDLEDDKDIARYYVEYKKYMSASSVYNDVISKEKYHVRCIHLLPDNDVSEETEERETEDVVLNNTDDYPSAADALIQSRDAELPLFWNHVKSGIRRGKQSVDVLFMSDHFLTGAQIDSFINAGYDVHIKRYKDDTFTSTVSWKYAEPGVKGKVTTDGMYIAGR